MNSLVMCSSITKLFLNKKQMLNSKEYMAVKTNSNKGTCGAKHKALEFSR